MKNKSLQLIAATFLAVTGLTSNAQSWNLTGNSGTSAATNFLGTTDAKPVVFRTNNVERMRILKTGETGIGITNPKSLLHIAAGNFVSLTSSGTVMIGSVTGNNMALDWNVIQARNNGVAAPLWLNYYGGPTYIGPSSSLQIAADGTVGIKGGSNSSYALNVHATSALGGIFVTDPVDGNVLRSVKSGLNAGIYVEKTNNSSLIAAIYGNSSAGSGAGVEGASANGDGVYGYSANGYGVEAYANNDNGLYATTNNNASYYAGFFVGDVYTNGNYFGSDEKLKQNIQDFTSAMNIINQLHPKQYQFRQDGNYKLMNLPQGQHYGLIAQDVEKVLPNLVKDSKFETPRKPVTSENDVQKSETIDFKALNYTELIPVLIKAIQEQQQQIDELNQKVETLTADKNSSSLNSSVVNVSGAYLQQNTPNPFNQNTTIHCYVPSSSKQAQLGIYTMNGKLLRSYTLSNGMNDVTLNAGTLSSGQYVYSLLIDGKKLDSKNMIMTK
jgi:hypothetical protein